MGEIPSAIAEAIRNRATSTTLVTYSAFWLAWHWQGVYVTLFISEDKIFAKYAILKNEYVNHYFFGWQGWDTFWGFLIPLVLTVLFIWPFQKFVLIHAYKIEQGSKTDRKKVQEDNKRELQLYKTKVLVQESAKTEAETKKVEAETKLSETKKKAAKTDPSIVWDDDYEKFKKSVFYPKFGDIRDAIYEHNGRYHLSAYENGVEFNLGSDLLAFTDTEELITIDRKTETISLTAKGRYFLKKYQSELSELPF